MKKIIQSRIKAYKFKLQESEKFLRLANEVENPPINMLVARNELINRIGKYKGVIKELEWLAASGD